MKVVLPTGSLAQKDFQPIARCKKWRLSNTGASIVHANDNTAVTMHKKHRNTNARGHKGAATSLSLCTGRCGGHCQFIRPGVAIWYGHVQTATASGLNRCRQAWAPESILNQLFTYVRNVQVRGAAKASDQNLPSLFMAQHCHNIPQVIGSTVCSTLRAFPPTFSPSSPCKPLAQSTNCT